MLEILTDAGTPLRAKQVAVGVGLGSEKLSKCAQAHRRPAAGGGVPHCARSHRSNRGPDAVCVDLVSDSGRAWVRQEEGREERQGEEAGPAAQRGRHGGGVPGRCGAVVAERPWTAEPRAGSPAPLQWLVHHAAPTPLDVVTSVINHAGMR
ncbi:hypothetical protein ACQB60_32420 [Actinomycetota bacterium Odt1-20B]